MKKMLSLFLLVLFVSTLFLCEPIAVKAETLPNDLKFLSYCDEEKLAQWDEQIASFTESEAAEMETYLEKNVVKSGMTDYEKASAIYNWIWTNVEYASQLDQTAYLDPYDVFIYKSAVCGGYSNLYKAMLNLMDIPSALISGMTPYGAHVWNAVYADGRWFYSDATWGGEYFDKGVTAFLQDHYSQRVELVNASAGGNVLVGYDNGIAVVGVENGATTVTIPDTFEEFFITSISYQLFSSSYGVKVVNVGDCITEITENYSKTLEAIHVSEYNSVYASKDGVLFSKDMSRIWIYPIEKKDTDFTLPKETTILDLKETFKNEYLINLEVEEGNAAFSSYEGALYDAAQTELLTVPLGKTKVYVPDNATIGNVAFANADTSKMTIYAKGETPAHQYALENNIAFVNIEEEEQDKPVVKPEEKVYEVFEDVAEDAWYVNDVQYVYDKGLMSGSNGLFKPDGDNGWVLRQQFVEILWRMENKPEAKGEQALKDLVDVPEDAYYKESLCWAYENGIINGVNGKYFAGGNKLSRQQLATMMYRYAEKMGYDTSKTADYSAMPGAEQVEAYAEDAMSWAVGSEIISGSGADKALNPTQGATRAQLAAILQRFCENIK